MLDGRLPDGFGVRIDPRVRVFGGGRVLIGGSPTRMLKLAPLAVRMIDVDFLEVTDAQSSQLARRLLDAGVAHPRPMAGPSRSEVTVVIPTRDNHKGLDRLLPTLRGLRVIVVDDGSSTPVERRGVTVIRHENSRGPAAARNTGLATATTDYVAFLDSDVVPNASWLEVLLGHFSDPLVALVAPRIVALVHDSGVVSRYELARSSLDLGRREAPILAGSPVSYVPSAAMAVRRRAIDELCGFDESMQVAEDVDLCWRLQDSGWRMRYEPVARVAHDHRVDFGKWFGRKVFYGTGAAPLAARHPDLVPPVALAPWTLVTYVAAATGTRIGAAGALVATGATTIRLRRKFTDLDEPTRVAGGLAAQGLAWAGLQLASAMCRHYWPLTVGGALVSKRFRRLALAVLVAEGISDWMHHREVGGLDLARYVVLKRMDDVAYGTGLWLGVIRSRSLAALKPKLRGQP